MENLFAEKKLNMYSLSVDLPRMLIKFQKRIWKRVLKFDRNEKNRKLEKIEKKVGHKIYGMLQSFEVLFVAKLNFDCNDVFRIFVNLIWEIFTRLYHLFCLQSHERGIYNFEYCN